jgi:hypothetical protein
MFWSTDRLRSDLLETQSLRRISDQCHLRSPLIGLIGNAIYPIQNMLLYIFGVGIYPSLLIKLVESIPKIGLEIRWFASIPANSRTNYLYSRQRENSIVDRLNHY